MVISYTILIFNRVSNPNKLKTVIDLPLAEFLIILGTSNIAVVLPTINEHFGITQTNLQWIHNACVIAFGTLIIWMGLGKIFTISFLSQW